MLIQPALLRLPVFEFFGMHKKGFTLIEILISALLLALLMVGMGNIFISSKKLIQHSRSRMTSGELGKAFLDPLNMQVRQDTWAANCLGTANCPDQTVTLDRPYTADYTVTNNNPALNLNRVVINITWNDTD